jgi:hypothetical protein
VEPPVALATVHAPRAVPVSRVVAWYEEAMRLFKRAPVIWCVLGLITVASELALSFVPGIGVALAKVIVPVIECGMLLGVAAVDRGEPLQVRVAVAVFAARPAALAAIVVSALLIFGVEAWTAYSVAGINLLENGDGETSLTDATLASVFAAGTLVSLPVMFVPFAALFEGASFMRAFATSARGFALNILPLLIFGAFALVLVLIGLLSFGFGLIAIFPLLSAASYAAWKDVYVVATPPGNRAS